MLVIPAIDLKDGKAVRLVQGAPEASKVYSPDPMEVARRFIEAGARRLHVVDLDGAFQGLAVHHNVIAVIVGLGTPVQVGGGIRTMEALDTYIGAGVGWAILGTAAIRDRTFLKHALDRHGDKVIVGIDARDGKVRVEGWAATSEVSPEELASQVRDMGCRRVIYTNIATDGTLAGPDVTGLEKLARHSPGMAYTASGGVGSLDDLIRLKTLEPLGVDSVIVGKAIYERRLDLAVAQRTVG